MALGETGDWAGATGRIVNMINGKADPLEGALPEGYGSGRILEAFAREFEADHGMELGMSFPALLAGFSGACQGAFLAPMVKDVTPGLSLLWTSLVIQFIGIAEAGQQKSTMLKEVMDPLKRALDRGEAAEARRKLVEAWRKEAMDAFDHTGLKVDGGDGAWEKVYNGGLCPSSITDQGTPEGIRNNIVRHGGHRVILTAEPDVLAEVNQYANKGASGSIGLFLRGWNQEDLAVDRASTEALYVREPSLPYVIMLQPDSFQKHTGGNGAGDDDFIDRGLFSRSLLWKAERTPVDGDASVDWDLGDLDFGGLDLKATETGPLWTMRGVIAERMEAVALRSNPYRVSKGLEQAWREHKVLWMPRPKEVHRERLEFDGLDGVKEGWRVQLMRAAVRRAVAAADAVTPGVATLLDPMAVRFTDHVMRIAAVLTLASDPAAKVVDTGHVEDVATRVMPWLWAGWLRVMRERLEASAAQQVEESVLKNPKGMDLSGGAVILRALARMTEDDVSKAMGGFTPSEIFKRAKRSMKGVKKSPAWITNHLHAELDDLVAEGSVEKVAVVTDAAGKESARYRISADMLNKIKNSGQ